MHCDICNNISKQDNSYALATFQVVYSTEYWKYCVSLAESLSPGRVERHPLKFVAVVKRLCESQSGWLVCSDCIQYFDVDLEAAKGLLEPMLKKDPETLILRRAGADLRLALVAASTAWTDKFGSNLMALLADSTGWRHKVGSDLVELIKTELAELPEGSNRMLICDEIGTKREHFWKFVKRHFG